MCFLRTPSSTHTASRRNLSGPEAELATDSVRHRPKMLQIEKLPDRDPQCRMDPAMMSGAKELRCFSGTSSQFFATQFGFILCATSAYSASLRFTVTCT